MDRNDVCVQCKSRAATMFCACTSPETLLCKGCWDEHSAKNPYSEHPMHPKEQLPYYRIPGYYDRLKVRRTNFPKIQSQLQTNIDEIDAAIQQFDQEICRLICAITSYAETVVRQMKETKVTLQTQVNAALEEVQRTLNEDQPQLTQEYSPVFRHIIQTSRDVRLFSFSLQAAAPAPSALVSLTSHIANPSELRPWFVSIYESQVSLYDVETRKLSKHSLTVDFGNGVAYLQLEANKVLCVGAYPPSAAVYELELPSCQLTPQSALNTPRAFAGIAQVESRAYVFGGVNDSNRLSTCEKMDLSDKRWVQLRNQMHSPRSSFTPCQHGGLIYLVGWVAPVETFTPQTDTFNLLPIQLPQDLLGWNSVAFIVDGELCLLTWNKQMGRWKVGVEAQFRVSSLDRKCWSGAQPRVVGLEVLIACEGGVYRFSLVSYAFLNS